MAEIIRKCRCLKCGHEWFPKSTTKPRRCPNPDCRSLAWERPPLKASGNFGKGKRKQKQGELTL